jgi:hypothetical protein
MQVKSLYSIRVGYQAGAANKVGVCNRFTGSDATICFKAKDDGFDSNIAIWGKTSSFKHGYQLGLHEARVKITGDNVGACQICNSTSTVNLCMAGYDRGYESDRN